MNVCLLSDKYPPDPGGLAVSARRLALGLAAAGHAVHVCAPDAALPPGQLTNTVQDGLHLHRLGVHRRRDDTRSDWFERVVSLHRHHRFDLLHGYYLAGAGFVAVYAARYLDLPAVVSARGNDLDRTVFDPGQAGAIVWALAQAGAVTAVSTDLARRARALSGREVRVIPNGVDAGLFAPAARDTALAGRFRAGEVPLVGFVGEARQKKGLGILLPAFGRTVAAGSPAHLLLVGGTRPEAAEMVAVFQARQPQAPVSVIPPVDHDRLPAWYNLLDILVLPSLRDGLPNALLEGMACGRAVIASHTGGIPDVVRHGENGWLVPPGDEAALAAALAELMSRPDERAALGRAARATVTGKFTPAAELAANLALYADLLGPAASGKPPAAAPGPSAR